MSINLRVTTSFMLDARSSVIEKAAIKIPEDFLKRWLYSANEGKFTTEEIERIFHCLLRILNGSS